MEAIKVNEYVWLKLSESEKYGYDLQEGREYQGEFKLNWCKKEFGPKDNKTEKNVPVTIKLGPKERAIEVLEALLFELRGEDVPQGHDNVPDDTGDIPF